MLVEFIGGGLTKMKIEKTGKAVRLIAALKKCKGRATLAGIARIMKLSEDSAYNLLSDVYWQFDKLGMASKLTPILPSDIIAPVRAVLTDSQIDELLGE
jgi:hypothetical protein